MAQPAELTPPTAWSFACPDWRARLAAGRPPTPDLPLDRTEAERAIGIFNKLRLPDVPGRPAMASAAGEWFREIVAALFGSLDERGARQVPEVFCLVPKKNSKTTNGAGLMLTALLMNRRPRAEFLLIGPTQEIADTAFQQASGMIEADEYLAKRFHVVDHRKSIVDRLTKATLKIKTFDMKVMTGAKPVGVLIDELHVMASMSGATRVIGQIRGGLLANPESFLVFITTQSDEPPAGAFRAELQYARGIRDGRIAHGRTLPVLYEFPEEVQTGREQPWRDPALWPMVLPNLGRSITIERLTADWEMAQEKGEEEVRRWASQHLNVEIGLGLHAERWRGADHWEAAADPALTLDEILIRAEVVTVGIDGGGLDDLLGLAVIGRCRETREWLLWARAWAQDDVLERRKQIADRLRDFRDQGDLVICSEDPTQDVDELADIVQRIHAAELLPAKYGVGLDPIGVSAIVDALEERGVQTEANGGPVCAVPQGFRMSAAVWGMERKLKDGTLRHAAQPMMSWCVGNAKVEPRGNAVLVTKQAAGKAKIDPLMAGFNAFTLMGRGPLPVRDRLDGFLADPVMVI